jgi:class 3 adenylate cyclase/tetratricopeptide (TPR) repeat protein
MQVDGTLALVDISGFTRLTERLARKGNVGAEEMSDLLDATFSALLADARAQDADLVKWGGDAVLLLFSGAEHAARACCAAFDMRATLRAVGTLSTTSGTVTLRMSVGVHSGLFDFYLVGDPQHHRELLVVGPEASRTADMEALADAGQVALSDSTAALLPARTHRPGPRPGSRLLRGRPSGAQDAALTPQGPPVAEAALEQFLPRAVRAQVLAEQGEAEHRCVTVAFVRFSGTDELARTHGTTAVAEALDQCVRNVQHASAEHDVTFFETDIDRDGGKVMLVAGAPRSSGRDEERMLRAVRAVMERAGVLALRIGVNRGDVFAGDFGPPFRRTYSIKGDPVNLAARLLGTAAAGEVLATAATLERSPTRFDTEPLEPFLVKGKSLPVSASRVGPLLGADQARRPSSPFVGRQDELDRLRAALSRATDGAGGLVELVGEAGIGKSRLITELLRSSPALTVLTGACRPYDATTPYFPFRSLLRDALGVRHDADGATTVGRLREVVASAAPGLMPWLPLLAVPLDVEVPATRESDELDPQYRKARLEEAVEELLTGLTVGPLVLVLEDVQHLDDASCDLLALLARTAPDRSWLLVVTRRDTEGGFVPEPGPHLQTLRPMPLAPDESLRLARAAATHPMTRQAATALTERGGGNPLFLEELVATAGRLGSVVDLPESVQDLVTSQIDRLAPLDRLVLRYAAVLGTTADTDVLERLLVAHRADVRLDEHLPALADFLDPHGNRQVRFRHALMRDVAYEGLPYRRRRLLHAHVAETLERTAQDHEQVSELLSLHYFQAGRFDRAWSFSRTAGERAREKYANSEAIELLQRAVEAARRSAGGIDPGELSDVLEALGDVSHLAGRSTGAIDAYRAARRRRRADPVAVARLLSKEARTQQRLGKVPQSLRLVRRTFASLEGVEGAAASATRSDLATRYALGRLRQGRYADALSWATLAACEAEASGDKSTLALAYNSLHAAHYYAGVAADVPYARLALLAYEELGDLAGQAHCANNLGVEALDAGRLAESAGYFARAREIFGRLGGEADEANATYNQADAMLRLDRHAEAEPLLHEALGIARAVGDEELVALVLRETGQLCLRLGRLEQARAHFADARTRLTELGLVQELALLEDADREALRVVEEQGC